MRSVSETVRPRCHRHLPSRRGWRRNPHLDIHQTDSGDELRLRRGAYRLPEHLVLPRGFMTCSIESGAELQLGAGRRCARAWRSATSAGSEDQPVTIRPIEPGQPFGAVAVVGDGSERTEVTWLELSGGSDAWLGGAHFAGALSIHYQDRVSVSHTTIRDNQGADGLSIKYAAGAITDSSFTGNRDDQVDLEYFDGLVRDSRFEGAPTGDPNGDGLDLRGSRVVVVNNGVHWRRRQSGKRGRGERGAVRLESCRPQRHRGGGQGSLDGLPVRQPVRRESPRRARLPEETVLWRWPSGVRGGRPAAVGPVGRRR